MYLLLEGDQYQLCYINGRLGDVDTPLQQNSNLHPLPTPTDDSAMFSREKQTKDFFQTLWHSSTHLLAYALEQYYGSKVKLIHGASGEGIPYCFYYEVTLSVILCIELHRSVMPHLISI